MRGSDSEALKAAIASRAADFSAVKTLLEVVEEGDLVLFMGAGDIGALGRQLVEDGS